MNTQVSPSVKRLACLALVAIAAASCASKPLEIDTSPGAETTFDGLHKVANARADEAWARPGLDLSGYTKIILEDAGIEYRPGGESGRTSVARTRGGPYEVTEAQKERLQAIVTGEFRKELAKSEHFTIVDEAGPDVLLVRGGLLDVVSNVPPEPVGRADFYLTSVGEATLVIELRDSITNAILARAMDRRAAERPGGTLFEANRATNASEVRRLAQRWASLLRARLDEYLGP